MRLPLPLSLVLGLGLLCSCAEEDPQVEKDSLLTVVKSPLARDLDPDVTGETLAQLTTDNAEFAWKLYHRLADEEDATNNIIFSPYSVSTALAMLYAGAADQAKIDLAGALNFQLEDERLHKSFNKLSLLMDSRNLPEDGDYSALTLNMTNTLWPSVGHIRGMSDQFLDVLAEHYDSEVYAMDYASDADACRVEINDAIYQWTNELVDNLIPPGELNMYTSFVITNTIYLKAPWDEAFVDWGTSDGEFENIDGSLATVRMMRYSLDKPMRYSANEQVQALAIPYRGRDLEMVVLLPNVGEFQDFEAALTEESVSQLIDQLDYTDGTVVLRMPKFSFDYGKSLIEILEGMGMNMGDDPDAYALIDRGAEITGINHKAFIGVDEFGTESAAATSVSGSSGSIPPVDVQFFVDRPFIFVIHDRPTGNLLFVGRVTTLVE